jgi:hypothetical protein
MLISRDGLLDFAVQLGINPKGGSNAGPLDEAAPTLAKIAPGFGLHLVDPVEQNRRTSTANSRDLRLRIGRR